jgi:hypothetical protein
MLLSLLAWALASLFHSPSLERVIGGPTIAQIVVLGLSHSLIIHFFLLSHTFDAWCRYTFGGLVRDEGMLGS